MLTARTLYDKLWDSHLVTQAPGHPAVLYVDLQLLHDGTFRRAFEILAERGLRVANPARHVGVTDHCLPTRGPLDQLPPIVSGLVAECQRHSIRVIGPQDDSQGIVHIIGPQEGLTQPGMVIVCADSHTTTHGALGALGLVVGTTQIVHALATNSILQRRAQNMRINVTGRMNHGTTAKDLLLAIIRSLGTAAASGFALEYTGQA
ncbi:MAG: aconitase family protein, partial [Acidimicrobiia bacterium]